MITRLCLLALVGCRADKGGTSRDTSEDTGSTAPLATSFSTLSTAAGSATVAVPVQEGDASFLVTATSSADLAVSQVMDPSGEVVFDAADWGDGTYALTSAVWAAATDVVFNWPVRAEDGPLSAGVWSVTLAAEEAGGSASEGAAVNVATQVKRDADLSTATVHVAIRYTGGLQDNADVVAAAEGAVARWRTIWAGYGLTLDETWGASDLDLSVDDPGLGSDALLAEAERTEDDDFLLLICEEVGGSRAYYALTGDIPDALTGTPRAAEVVAWLPHAGADGVFSDDEVRLMGETFAHEAGHYMGLFHPVEASFTLWDALEDTPECSSQETCEAELGDNLMYPYPICDGSTCQPQELLSDDQLGVLQRYTGAL